MLKLKGQCQVKPLYLFISFSLLFLSGVYVTMPLAQADTHCEGEDCVRPISLHGLIQPLTTTTTQPPRQTNQSLAISQEVVRFDQDLEEEVVTTKNDPAIIGYAVTYTIIITNISKNTLKGLLVADVLPHDAFDKWNFTECPDVDNCTLSPAEATNTSTPPRQISWKLAELKPNESKSYTFSGILVCQPDLSILTNEVFVSYEGTNQNHISEIMVYATLDAAGGELMLGGPTWCSFGAEGGYDLDWGDFDSDGDLDLALATDTGVVVYQNNQGLLKSFWRSSEYFSQGVRWADVSKSSPGLELVTIGRVYDDKFDSLPINLIYQFTDTEFTELQSFTSDILRSIELADYNGDGFMDIAGGFYNSGSCLVRLYRNDGLGNFSNDGCPVATTGAGFNALAWGDFNQDGKPDLAVGASTITLLINDGQGNFSSKNLTNVLTSPIIALSWGDYDGNGYLDLVASFYINNEVWLFWNNKGVLGLPDITTINIHAPSGVDGADFDHDGRLDLVVASDADGGTLKIFTMEGDDREFEPLIERSTAQNTASAWTTRSADVDNDGDMDIAIANEGQSVLFINLGIFLDREPTFISSESVSANSVVWGDMDSDKDLDLVLGAGVDNNALGTTLYKNQQNKFTPADEYPGLGPRQVALGDYDNDGRLDLAMTDATRSEIYLNGKTGTSIWRENISGGHSLAWGDANDDGYLDLLVGATGYSKILFNKLNTASTNPLTSLTLNTGYDAASVAWGDYNRDRYLDFAIVNSNGPTQVYCNNRDNTFKLAWQSTISVMGQAVAWADYDEDGDLDLTEGSWGAAGSRSTLRVYDNAICNTQTCNPDLPFSTAQVSCTDVSFSNNDVGINIRPAAFLTGLAWGDADNDGDLDLALSFEGKPNLVYFFYKKENGEMQFDPNWLANAVYPSTGVAWGDVDNDGDLDLAFSGRGNFTMIYYNHLNDTQRLLPNQPARVVIERPGKTDMGYFYSVGQDVVSGATVPTVTIKYRIYDSDGDGVVTTTFDYSLNGGTVWLPATPNYTPTDIVPSTLLGKPLTFQWDAQADQAMSDNALFRITTQSLFGSDHTALYRYGATQRATSAGISPPFRVRGTTCLWPENPTFTWYNVTTGVERPTNLTISDTVEFQARVATASRGLTFEWNFGAGTTPAKGQVIRRKFSPAMSYPITLRVTSEACPIAKSVTNNRETIFINGGRLAYLPLLLRAAWNSSTPTPTAIPAKLPNLVSTFSLDPANPQIDEAVTIMVQVTNDSEITTTQPFYVDFYINPANAPTTAIPWYEQRPNKGGLQWYTTKKLAPHQSMTFDSNDADFAQWTGVFMTYPLNLYSYADSDGHGDPNGLVLESNEQDNSYNLNIDSNIRQVLADNSPPQVADLSGQDSPTATSLTWSAVGDNIMGYRLYRLGLAQSGPFQLLATLPATATSYTDSPAICGQMYYLTTFNDFGESDASLTSYFSSPCP